MKKLFTSISIVILGFNLSAQDTIKLHSLPKPGFTYIVPNDTVTTYVIPAGSASAQTWNYSNLIEHYSKVPTYDSTSETAYASAFPTSNIFTYGPAALYSGFFGTAPVANQGFNNGYMFWKADSTGFWVEGFRPDDGGNPHYETHTTPHELLIPLPGYYNFDTTTHSTWTISINQNASNIDTFYVSNAYKGFKYDGFGTLTTPIATYNNVVRLHDYTIKVDSVYSKIGSTVVFSMEIARDSTHTYYYLDKNTDYPVMTTYADVNNNVLYTEYYKVKYPFDYNLSVQSLSNVNIELYPNPVSSELNVLIDEDAVEMSVLTLDGKQVQNFYLINGMNVLNVDIAESGIFLAVFKKDGQIISTKRIVKM